MSVQTEINRLKQAVSNAFTAVGNKGGTVPASKISGNLASAIESIPSGVELNFDIVSGYTEPTNPKENTIWIKTGITIANYVFSPTQPQNPAERTAWFMTSTASPVEFNALKENCIQVCPVSVKGYYGGEWADWTAQTYQNGAWVDWWVWDGGLFAIGDEYEPVTGGWICSQQGDKDSSMTIDNSGITLAANQNNAILAATAKKIDMTGYSTLCASATDYENGQSWDCYLKLGNTNDINNEDYTASVQVTRFSSPTVYRMDVSSVQEPCYVVLLLYGSDGIGVTFDRVWLE